MNYELKKKTFRFPTILRMIKVFLVNFSVNKALQFPCLFFIFKMKYFYFCCIDM